MDLLLDIFNENNKPLGFKRSITEVHLTGLWHRSSHVWVYNSKRQILLQFRNKNKQMYPNMWDISAAGQVDAGETPLISGLRELKEELGIEAKADDLEFYRIRKVDTNYNQYFEREFQYIYFLRYELNIKNLKLEKSEVKEVKFFNLDELESDLKLHPEKFVPHDEVWGEVINFVKNKI